MIPGRAHCPPSSLRLYHSTRPLYRGSGGQKVQVSERRELAIPWLFVTLRVSRGKNSASESASERNQGVGHSLSLLFPFGQNTEHIFFTQHLSLNIRRNAPRELAISCLLIYSSLITSLLQNGFLKLPFLCARKRNTTPTIRQIEIVMMEASAPNLPPVSNSGPASLA